MRLIPRFVSKLFEQRLSPENPTTNLAQVIEQWEIAQGLQSATGVVVNAQTALRLTVVIACVRVLAEGVASLPLNVYRRRKDGGKDRATEHPVHQLLHARPTPELPSFVWRETLMAHLALRGNAYVEKEINGRGDVIGLWPISPDRVTVERVNGVKRFQILVGGAPKPFTSDRIMHVPGLGYDGLVGYNPIQLARDAIGTGLAAQEHGGRFFSNNAEPGGLLEHPNKLSKDAYEKLKASWNAKHAGSANAHRVAILEEGMKWQSLGVTNKDSQFLELRKFSVSDIARFYRVPPHLVGDLEKATFSNIEQQSIDFVVHTLRPWLVRWEQVLNWELFDEREREEFFCEFNVEGLLRGDSAARGEFYTKMFNIGVFSINDIREKENANPVEGGERRFVPLNMVPLDKAGQQPAPEDPPANGDDDDEEDRDDSFARAQAAFEPLVADVLRRSLERDATALRRSAKKGAVAIIAWDDESRAERIDYLGRALEPVTRGLAAMLGADVPDVRASAITEVERRGNAFRVLGDHVEDAITAWRDAIDHRARDLTAAIIGAMRAIQERKAA